MEASRLLLICSLFGACAAAPDGKPPPSIEDETRVALPVRGSDWLRDVVVPEDIEPLDEAAKMRVATLITALGSRDFALYSTAAGALVEVGEPAVPYLGYVGEAAGNEGRVLSIVTVILEPILKALEPARLAERLRSPYAAVRAAAASTVAGRRLLDLAPLLGGLLDDEQVVVRRAVIRALRILFNRYHGYRPSDPPAARAEPTRLWRELLAPR